MNPNAKAAGAILAVALVSGCVTVDVDRALSHYDDCVSSSDLAARLETDPREYLGKLAVDRNTGFGDAAAKADEKALRSCDLAIQMLQDAQSNTGPGQDLDKGVAGTLMGTRVMALYLRSEIRSMLYGPPVGDDGEPDWRLIHDENEIIAAAEAATSTANSGDVFIGANLRMYLASMPAYRDYTKLRQGIESKKLGESTFKEIHASNLTCSADKHLVETLNVDRGTRVDSAAKLRHATNRTIMAAALYEHKMTPFNGARKPDFYCKDTDPDPTSDKNKTFCEDQFNINNTYLTPVVGKACETLALAVRALGDAQLIDLAALKKSKDWKNTVLTKLKMTTTWNDLETFMKPSFSNASTALEACLDLDFTKNDSDKRIASEFSAKNFRSAVTDKDGKALLVKSIIDSNMIPTPSCKIASE